MRNEQWLNPSQERALQRKQSAEIAKLPILEQAKMLRRDAETLAEIIEFGREVQTLLERFGMADAIPEDALKDAVVGSDYPPGMALALARTFEQRKKGQTIH